MDFDIKSMSIGPSPAWGAFLILQGVVRVSFARVHACPHRQVEQMGVAMAAKAREAWQQTAVLLFRWFRLPFAEGVVFRVLVCRSKTTVVLQCFWDPFGIDVPVYFYPGNAE